MKRHVLIVFISAVISCLFPVSAFCAPYLGKEFEFHQPDGSPIAVRVWGDEFYIRAETPDGYSLVRDPASGFICYARVNSDDSDFISTGIPYTGQTVEKLKYSGLWPLSQGKGIVKGLRLKRQSVIAKADRNRYLLRRDQRGRILPAPDSDAFPAAPAQAGSPAPLIGQVVGLTLLIQFPDVPATISQTDVNDYCNKVGYTGYGNNGSVRDYFYDVSNGNLTYTNYVTVYYTAQYNRSYYTDESISYGTRARELIEEALLWLDDPSGQNFDFGAISADSSNYMLAINAFYAGPAVNNWAEGLWPHMSSMYGSFTSNEGVRSGVYQITNIGSSLALGTFCHENGHMICGYPDLYDYGYESYGVGNYCLMAYGGSDSNPIPPNPYLRDIKGWESVTVIPNLSGVQYFLQSNSNTSYKYLNPDNSSEFFYIESRTKTGRNSSLPDDGLVIWHIDENGSNDDQQMTPSQHYLVSVEQADGLFHLEHGNNVGGSGDLFHAGYNDTFRDTTTPNARWWNGNNSNLVIRQISGVGSTMSFVYEDGTIPQPPIAQPGSASTPNSTSVSTTLVATDEGLPNPPGALTYIVTSLPSNGELTDPDYGIITSVPYSLVGFGDQVIYTPDSSYTGSDSFQFKVNDGGTSPEGGDSNIATVSISVFGVIYMANMDTDPGWSAAGQWQWGLPTGHGGTSYGNPDPTGGHTGSRVYGVNLNGDYSTTVGGPYYLTTQAINCSGFENIHLKFYRWLNSDYQPYVSATIQVSNNASAWTTVWQNDAIQEITDSSWQLLDYDISSVADDQPNVYIRWGYNIANLAYAYSGWNIDDVMITGVGDTVAPTPDPMTFAAPPQAVGTDAIAMTATTATDESDVEYYFACTSGGGHDSGWQDGTLYTDTGLANNTTYAYRVMARDKSLDRNETGWSDEPNATTLRYDCSGSIPADLNANCQTDFFDYALLAAAWSVSGPGNLVVNGSFETDISGWQAASQPYAMGSMTTSFDGTEGNPAGSARLQTDTTLVDVDGHYFYQIIPVEYGSQYRLSGDWKGSLEGLIPSNPDGVNWIFVFVGFTDEDPLTDSSIWESLAYAKAFGEPNFNIGPTGTWDWESILASPYDGPTDGIFIATADHAVVIFGLGGILGSGASSVNIDNIGFDEVGECPSVDLNSDCLLNMKDIAIFAEQWLTCNRDPSTECWM